MKPIYFIVLIAFLMSACSSAPSADAVATSVAATVVAQQVSSPTVLQPTNTTAPTITNTPKPTNTPRPTLTRTSMPTSTPAPEIGSYEIPYPYGYSMSLGNSTQEFKITLKDVKRGDDAWQMLYNVNQFNEPAPEGMEWIGTLIKTEYTKGPSGKVLELDRYFVNTVTKGSILEIPFYLGPDPEFDLKILPGGEGEGWIFGHVYVDDSDPMVVFAYSGGNPGFYMSLTP